MTFYKITQWQLMLILASAALLLGNGAAVAQNVTTITDTTPPVIVLEELADGVADSSQVFTVQITEESELQDATLYYRRNGEEPYAVAPLQVLGNSDLYTVSIDTDPTDQRPIEYYIQARDASGNRTVSGFAFDPYSRSLAPALAVRSRPEPAEDADADSAERLPIATATPFYKKRWFQVTLGVLAVGALASTLNGGDDDRQLAPVTFTLE